MRIKSKRTAQKINPAIYRHSIRFLTLHHPQRFIKDSFTRLFVINNLNQPVCERTPALICILDQSYAAPKGELDSAE